ncbi:bifunctional protein tyrosine phosphatase family protein/NAD(P)/FAD-dependent oxidoreductase [Mangrovitalea sediminis]|uniref:bifunctional protein tyrosine phosphatase family protein/NAD(P)/FAD-dependent oxidoreductase n=1 Tax=Mangrovitalea sediminis TaxID=1982043 RepID=UPI000BE51D66|nr:bifunctional protein tyrosine phosphatase family protein/NAD(P)/FAD-dependent oxidoreductase [Mangrovitalea sediminis]
MVDRKKLTPFLWVSPQISESDIGSLAAAGFRTVVCNRPEGESSDQPATAALEQAVKRQGMDFVHLPVRSGDITDQNVKDFRHLLETVSGPVLAFCRTGTRSTSLWALAEAHHLTPDTVIATAAEAGYDLSGLRGRLDTTWQKADKKASKQAPSSNLPRFDTLIVGGGAGGLAAAASLLKRRPNLSIAVVEPSDKHYYQPAWTLVGAGAFARSGTEKAMAGVIPAGCKWIRAAASDFDPENQAVILEDGERLHYRTLIVAPGLKLDWDAVEGLRDTLGRNGVTSNYLFDLAPYTWELVQNLKDGKALFTQPPMPIKCAGAPQKAMYLSCDHWQKQGRLPSINVEFNLAGAALFGVATFVPPLMKYVEKYGAQLAFNSNLIKVDGPAKKATFRVTDAEGNTETVTKSFDMLHVCPPQTAPDFIRNSVLANEAGWVEVNGETLQHSRYSNIFSLGDACSAPNAKTAAAVRKQAPVVAENLLAVLDGEPLRSIYDGYGSCPLTVERGKVVLAEFGYGGKLLPTFPLEPTVPRRVMWLLKAKLMPWIYFKLMLRGREWLAAPERLPHAPQPHESQTALNDEKRGR